MLERFKRGSSVSKRALQAYLVLIGLAWNRQTITYGDLSADQMGGYGRGGILANVLGCIMGWCYENGLPPLTSIVVNNQTGIPGEGLTTADEDDFPAAQQAVFRQNWFEIVPPSVEELAEAGKRAGAEQLNKPPKRLW